tara:strand:+ start:459 stop:1046 length:588 start_codon:yes stop_codon:yes gene_type:complete
MKKKPAGQIFPEEFYNLFTFNLGEISMFDKIKWLVLISLLGYIAYTDYMNDVRYVEHRKEVQAFINDTNNQFNKIDKKVWSASVKVVDDAVSDITKNNNEYITKVDSVLTLHESRRKELMSLLHDKIDFYGEKIDYFENSLDSTLSANNDYIVSVLNFKTDNIRQQIYELTKENEQIDSLFLQLKNNWLTKGAFK